jgi:predicted esterase
MVRPLTHIDGIGGPHDGLEVLAAGLPLSEAAVAMIMIHGRGASAAGILALADEFGRDDMACLAPQAVGNMWYPHTFLAPLERNQPWLDSALAAVRVLARYVEAAGHPAERTVLLGFSQGACLASEFVARNARRYGGIVALSGGLIGPPGLERAYDGALDGTPAFIGCSDADPHIPVERVRETAVVLDDLGAVVDLRLYPRMPHTVNQNEVIAVRDLLTGLIDGEG